MLRLRTSCAPLGPVLLLLAVSACDWDPTSPPIRTVGEVTLAEIITLDGSRNPASIPADGVAVDTFTATLPRDAEPRVVTFTTTKGTFERSATAEIAVRASTLDADDRLVARAVLQADTLPGRAFVKAAIAGRDTTVVVDMTATHPAGGTP